MSLASLWGKRLGIGAAATNLARLSSGALLVAAALVFLKRNSVQHPEALEVGLLLALTPLISPQGWDYVLVLATLVVLYVTNEFDRLPRALQALSIAGIAAVGLTLFDVLGRRLIYALLDVSVITIGMVALIGTLVSIRMRRFA